jgi:hypothetical protein
MFEKHIAAYLNKGQEDGRDLKTKVNSMEVLDEVSVKQSREKFIKDNFDGEEADNLAEGMKTIFAVKYTTSYNGLKWRKARAAELDEKSGIDYYVVKANFDIQAPLGPQTYNKVFLIDEKKGVIGVLNPNEYEEIKNEEFIVRQNKYEKEML